MLFLLQFLTCYILVAAVSGGFSCMLWVFMGRPYAYDDQDGFACLDYDRGMIFSRYTAWLARKYNEADKARQAWQEAHVQAKTRGIEQGTELHLCTTLKAWERGENKLNLYKALGACLPCFSGQTNNLAGFAFALGLYFNNVYWVLCLFTALLFWSSATLFTKLFARWYSR